MRGISRLLPNEMTFQNESLVRLDGIELIVVGTLLAMMAALFDAAGADTPLGRGVAAVTMVSSLLLTTVRGWRAANRMERDS